MECLHCQSTNLKKSGIDNGRQMYTCRDCLHKFIEGAKNHILRPILVKHKSINLCIQCGNETDKPRFCSQSCSSTYSNLNHPERYQKRRANRVIRVCKYCGIQLEGRRTTCIDCNRNVVKWEEVKLSDVQGQAKYQVSAQVRQRARYSYRNSDRPKCCVNCGYTKHYEVCHIRAIYDFPLDTTMATINDLSNLVALCPNCHWELDHNHLSIEEIRAKNNAIL